MNVKIIARVLGLLLVVEGLSMLVAMLVAMLYKGPDVTSFLVSALICIIPGLVIAFLTSKAPKNISKREGFIIVSLVWLVFSLFGSARSGISGWTR